MDELQQRERPRSVGHVCASDQGGRVDVANQLGQMTADVADSKDEAGYAGTAARLRVAASVFGF
jgi:hypothetical protein